MLLKMTGFQSRRSDLEKPWAYINFICLRIVDFPDSPAPVHQTCQPMSLKVPSLDALILML